MARRFIDGFESGDDGCWDASGGAGTVAGGYALSGNYGIFLDANALHWRSVNIPASSTYYFSFRIRTTSIGGLSICCFYEGATTQIGLFCSSNKIQIKRGGTVIDDSDTYTMTSNVTYRLSGWVYIHDSSGRVVVDVDGVNWIDFTGDTNNGGSGPLDKFLIGSFGGSVSRWYFDDIVLDDSTAINNSRIAGKAISGAGNSATWTPTSGNNYETVDEVPPSDADYNYVNSVDQTDTFAMASSGLSGETVKSVQVSARAQYEGAATPQSIALVVRPPTGGTDYAGSDQSLGTAWKGFRQIWENNPYTTAAWSVSEVDSTEAGYKSRT